MFEGIPLIGLTAPTLLGIAVLLMFTGRLVPRVTLQDKIAECDKWREAYEAERLARATSEAQTSELLEGIKANHDIITALFETIQLVDTIQKVNTHAGGDDALPKT